MYPRWVTRDCQQEHFTATYKENATDEQYQWDGALIINIKEDIKDLGPMQAVDMTRDRINRWLTEEKKRREEVVD